MYIFESRKLVNFIENSQLLTIRTPLPCPYNHHITALFADIILQAGVNYENIVKPRVNSILSRYPNAQNITDLTHIINLDGIEKILTWNNSIKVTRFNDLVDYCILNRINTCRDLRNHLENESNKEKLLHIKGIGNKTLDYLLKLLNIDTIAVDRHIYSFVEMAGIKGKDYKSIKSIVEYAADLMEIPRRVMDHSIWVFMSKKENTITTQYQIDGLC